MLQPAILPSNAPPLQTESGDARPPSRVLQEHSGNRQAHEYPNPVALPQKYPGFLLSESTYAPFRYPQPSATLYPPQVRPQHSQQYSPAFIYPHSEDAREEAEIAKNAKRLYRRFTLSEGYKKYRERQPKEGKEASKWPDHVEEAFFRALVKWPPMGRLKKFNKNRDSKQRGRNELIADYILELTGVGRDRKQVSSHIQVLKPFVEDDPYIMKWLSVGPANDSSAAQRAAHRGGGRRMSHHPVMDPHCGHARSGAQGIGPPTSIEYILREIIEPTDFQMFVQQKTGHDAIKVHTYTHSAPEGALQYIHLPGEQALSQRYPLLASMHACRPLNCTVLVADASFAVPLNSWRDKKGIELGISFICSSKKLTAGAQVSCTNKLYTNGIQLEEFGEEESELSFSNSETQPGVVDSQVKFISKFWAQTFYQASNRLIKARHMGIDARAEVAKHLESITATQEFVLTDYDVKQERVLVIHWTFRQSSQNIGRTSWRKLRFQHLQPDSLQYGSQLQHSHFKQAPVNNIDPAFDFNAPVTGQTLTSNTQAQVQQSQPTQLTAPTLQSPFSYHESQAAMSSLCTTDDSWPSTFSPSHTGPNGAHPDSQSQIQDSFPVENGFDFNGGQINLSYGLDPTFETFDSTAFNFDDMGDLSSVPHGDTAMTDFAVEPGLDRYSQHSWYLNSASFDSSAAAAAAAKGFETNTSFSTGTLQDDTEDSQATTDFNSQPSQPDEIFDSQGAQASHDFGDYNQGPSGEHQGIYSAQLKPEPECELRSEVTELPHHEQQAYGGAGRDGVPMNEAEGEGTALAALADASFLMGPMESRTEERAE